MEPRRINVLEHGFVELTATMGSDFSIYRNAKVSTGAPKDDIEDQKRLINFLVQNHHTSPLEFVEFEFHMKCPIYVARQHVRHRMQEMNEYSLRYRKAIEDFESVHDLEDLTEAEKMEFVKICNMEYEFYERVINRIKDKFPNKEDLHRRSRVREKLRGVLGTCFYSEMYWKMNLHSLSNWLSKRLAPGAQPEIRAYAKAVYELCQPVAPIAFDAMRTHWWKEVKDV
jgi:thymidylate synthase (FAD)